MSHTASTGPRASQPVGAHHLRGVAQRGDLQRGHLLGCPASACAARRLRTEVLWEMRQVSVCRERRVQLLGYPDTVPR